MSEEREIERAEWNEGDEWPCRCGRVIRLWFNGGELDLHRCECGVTHRTEHVRIDRVATSAPLPDAAAVGETEQPRDTTAHNRPSDAL